MKGMIRVLVGLVVTMAAAGGIDTATDLQLIPLTAIAAIGLAILGSGVTAAKENEYAV